jgi:hypothetical protein
LQADTGNGDESGTEPKNQRLAEAIRIRSRLLRVFRSPSGVYRIWDRHYCCAMRGGHTGKHYSAPQPINPIQFRRVFQDRRRKPRRRFKRIPYLLLTSFRTISAFMGQ